MAVSNAPQDLPVREDVPLSYWDAFALDRLSRPVSGVSTESPCGVTVEIHRNRINIRDALSWKQASGLHRPVCAVVASGLMAFHDTHVIAQSGPHDGVYMASWFVDEDQELACMVGVGCLGYEPGQDYRGICTDEVRYLAECLDRWRDLLPSGFPIFRWDNVLRFCQGDEFVASGAGFPCPVTPPGEAVMPLVMQRAARSSVQK